MRDGLGRIIHSKNKVVGRVTASRLRCGLDGGGGIRESRWRDDPVGVRASTGGGDVPSVECRLDSVVDYRGSMCRVVVKPDDGGGERRENTDETRDCWDHTDDRFRESTESPNSSAALLLYCRRKDKNNQKDEGGKRKRES